MKIKCISFALIALFLLAFKGIESKLFRYPFYFPKPNYSFKNNRLDSVQVELGRLLFYDPLLSKDNSISCASCHSPFNAFAHTDHALSHGIKDKIGHRNAPTLFNLAWQTSFMWDGAINHLDMQALAPISSETEMGETISGVVQKLQNDPFYQDKFFSIYKDSLVTGERVLKSLSQFQLTLISVNSKYDRVKKNKEEFSIQEQKGYQLFLQNCNSCHQEPLFSTFDFGRNFLPLDTALNDMGRLAVSQQQKDSLLFKIPSLRNLKYSFPYMHDGRFMTLNNVLNHYNDSLTREKMGKNAIFLSADEKVDLIAFLLTLSDQEFVFNPKHRFPKELLKHPREMRN